MRWSLRPLPLLNPSCRTNWLFHFSSRTASSAPEAPALCWRSGPVFAKRPVFLSLGPGDQQIDVIRVSGALRLGTNNPIVSDPIPARHARVGEKLRRPGLYCTRSPVTVAEAPTCASVCAARGREKGWELGPPG